MGNDRLVLSGSKVSIEKKNYTRYSPSDGLKETETLARCKSCEDVEGQLVVVDCLVMSVQLDCTEMIEDTHNIRHSPPC